MTFEGLIKMPRTIKLKGLNKRGKTRINNYSDDGTFLFCDTSKEIVPVKHQGLFILVESFKRNFKLANDHFIPWGGWLEVGIEVEIIGGKLT